MRITEAYKEQNRELHTTNATYGQSGKKWAGLVTDLVETNGCNTVLDYGCGKQSLAKAVPHLLIRGYDPCIEGLDDDPLPADLVVCGDVMEHVEADCVDEVLDHIQFLAKKCVLFVIACVPAKKKLPDGRNAHITIRDTNWWLGKLLERWTVVTYRIKPTGAQLVCIGVPLGGVQ